MRRLLLILSAIVGSYCLLWAQTQDYYDDIRRYKLFDHYDDNDGWIHGDTTLFNRLNHNTAQLLLSNLSIPSYDMRYSRRGMEHLSKMYRIGHLDIDYATARQLQQLSVGKHDTDHTTLFDLGNDRSYAEPHYTLQANLSGRGTLGGVGYRTTLHPLNGWSISLVTRVRAGRDIYIEGIDGAGFDIGVDLSRMFRCGTLSIVGVVPWSQRALRGASTEEAYTLLGNQHYNPSWGYLDGKRRSAREATSLRPEIVVVWSANVKNSTRYTISTNIYYHRESLSALAWFNAPTPLPDNYRYMPSYHREDESYSLVEQSWTTNDTRYTQIDWEGMMLTNTLQKESHAAYIVELRHANTLRSALSLDFESRVGSATIAYGVTLDSHTTRHYKTVKDLLGGDHIDNLDYMLIDDATFCRNMQNDLRNPDRTVREGERYGYDYRLSHLRATLYADAEWQLRDSRIALGANFATDMTQRRGYYEKELFRGRASYGLSQRAMLTPFKLYAKWELLRGAHLFGAHAAVEGITPEVDAMFLQPQYNNRLADDIALGTALNAELRYGYHSAKVDVIAIAFVAAHLNDIDAVRYYDDLAALYANATISNIDRLGYGIEAAATVRYTRRWSSTFSLSAGDYTYCSDANIKLYADNDNRLISNTRSDICGCRLAVPRATLSAEVAYRSFNGWYANLGVSYYAPSVPMLSYTRRSERVLSYALSVEERDALVAQQPTPHSVAVEARIAKSFRFRGGNSLWVQLSANNLLNSHIVYSGYEQNRIRRISSSYRNIVRPFDDKLTYAYPCNFRLAVSYRF